jgi:hypothetical protein
MMGLPPSNQFNRAPVQPSVQKQNGPSVGPQDDGSVNADDVAKNIQKVEDDLTDIIASLKPGSQLASALKKMGADLQDLLTSIKNQVSPNKLSKELKKMEGELKEITKKLDEKDKTALNMVQGEVATIAQQLQQLTTESVKTSELSAIDTRREVSKTIQLIQKMVQGIQVGSVGGVNFTSVDLKSTSEVPSFFANANVTITPGADGKMTVQFTNLTAEQQKAAIWAIQQHPELLLDLVSRVPLSKLQIGDQIITLPSAETTKEQGKGRDSGEQEQGRGDQERRGR